jgi:DNA-binding MarR family transcriptional regulator
MQLKQQQHFQQQQLSSLNFMNNNGDSTNIQVRVLSDQIKKLSVDNGNLEKQLKSKDLLIKEKEDLLR